MPVAPDAAWLAGQRWYGAGDRRLASVEEVASAPVADDLHWQVVRAGFEDGAPAWYQLFPDAAAGGDAAERAAAVRWLFPDLEVATTRLLGGEQSNTSVVVEPGPVVVKIFRRLTPEPNPDAEIVRRLWESGFRGVPEPLGERRARVPGLGGDGPEPKTDGGDADAGDEAGSDPEIDLAVARRFLAGSRDGWALALEAEDFTAQAAELGALTASMHLALARALGTSPLDGAATAARLVGHAHRVLGPDAPVGPLNRLAHSHGSPAIRAHGDYHLGQVLAHDGRWYALDFEGEPARPVADRVAPTSPLRDVAGMARSFAYAAAVAGHAPGWETACRTAFVERGYLATPGIRALLPDDPHPVIDAFELDKAIYEVGYERANRPDWVGIPMAAVERLAAAAQTAAAPASAARAEPAERSDAERC